MKSSTAIALATIGGLAATGVAAPIHVVLSIIDDLGYNDLGFRNNNEINTPNLDALATGGIVLDRYYVQSSCSPTRASILTGRFPLHHGINSVIDPWETNGGHPQIPGTGSYSLPLDEVLLSQMLKVGKWHLGVYRWEATPSFRGFDTFYGYYHGAEDYFNHTACGWGQFPAENFESSKVECFDLHRHSRPNCGAGCSTEPWDDHGQYSTNLFGAEAVNIISAHNVTMPLFFYLPWQGVHAPAQAPEHYVRPYEQRIADPVRRLFAGMLSAVDEGVGNVTKALTAKGMWPSTIFIVTTDNGAPITECGGIGGSNVPLRGCKCNLWEGGTRATAFIHSPLLKKSGYTYTGLVHGVDWLPTILSGALGEHEKDPDLVALTRKPLDGVSIWDAFNDNSSSPRTEVYYGVVRASTPARKDLFCSFPQRSIDRSWSLWVEQGERYIGTHGPAIRDAAGWKLIINGAGGVGGWNMKPGTGGVPPTPAGAKLGICGTMMDTFEHMCIPTDGFARYPTNSTEICCSRCLAARGCFSWVLRHDEEVCYLNTNDVQQGQAIPPHWPSSAGPCTYASVSAQGAIGNKSLSLYNVESDEQERHNLTAEQPAILARMQALLQEYTATGVPQCTDKLCGDPNCPKPAVKKDPQHGWYWEPWCS